MTEDMCYIARYFGFENPHRELHLKGTMVYFSEAHNFKINPIKETYINSTYSSLLTRLTNKIYPVFKTT